mgnify:CR=1 FL=1
MLKTTYRKYDSHDFILRDHLAIDRTMLSVERTFLSYLRTSLTFLIAGATFIKFFSEPVIVGLGWIFLPTGAMVFFLGLQRYIKMSRLMFAVKHEEYSHDNLTSTSFQIYLYLVRIFQSILPGVRGLFNPTQHLRKK